ncbi:BnaC08g43320D [Brassica napus]|uniref:BnaC08g43320D protein n=1 Tax=Brassica napus TaxID=3708 RepID=A0A078GDI0_BRANA|nr:BnaC08g43320D [Brassica napus]
MHASTQSSIQQQTGRQCSITTYTTTTTPAYSSSSSSTPTTVSTPVSAWGSCPHATRRGLVINEPVDELDVYDSQEEDDGENDTLVHQTAGDSGHLLLLHRSCLAPRQQDDKWLRTSIFRSTCTIQDRICSFIIDSGSCRNVISEDAVKKLGITAKPHPAPYSLGWLSEGVNLRITQRALVSFSVGPIYKDRLYFDVAPMDISHLILGRPWEYDRRVTHEGVTNTYSSTWNAQQIVLLPSREPPTPASPAPPAKQATLRTELIKALRGVL